MYAIWPGVATTLLLIHAPPALILSPINALNFI
jgi:hypothetical protein